MKNINILLIILLLPIILQTFACEIFCTSSSNIYNSKNTKKSPKCPFTANRFDQLCYKRKLQFYPLPQNSTNPYMMPRNNLQDIVII